MVDSSEVEYYNYDKVMSYNAMYNFIVGGRGIGKTYGAKVKAIKAAIKHGHQFIFMRRYRPEIIASKSTFFADLGKEFTDYQFRVNGWLAQYSSDGETWHTMGFFVSLSQAQSLKSVSFHNVRTLIYDEFIIEKGKVTYLPNEAAVFNNFYLTVDRFSDRVKAIFLANSVSIMNPYFNMYDIKPTEYVEIIVKEDGYIACHFPDSELFAQAVMGTRFGRFIKGTEYADYAVGNSFADNSDYLIGNKTSDAAYQFSLQVEETLLAFWFNAANGEFHVYEAQPKKPVIYVIDPADMRDGYRLMLKNDFRLKHAKSRFAHGLVFFDTPRARNAFTNIF